jgi:ribose 5-phosphate isomerase B
MAPEITVSTTSASKAGTPETIVIGSDHGGYALKSLIKSELAGEGYEVLDLGPEDEEAVDYPDYANALAVAILEGKAQRGILVCGSGIGMSIAANRHPGIRAALCHDAETARLSRLHNNANVLVLGGRLVGNAAAKEILRIFLTTPFEGGRHSRRLEKLA